MKTLMLAGIVTLLSFATTPAFALGGRRAPQDSINTNENRQLKETNAQMERETRGPSGPSGGADSREGRTGATGPSGRQ